MTCWDELGIAETAEAGAIKRAYAARLKQVRPDEDPAGFARLRAAYEAALAWAARAPRQPVSVAVEPGPQAEPDTAAPCEPVAAKPRPPSPGASGSAAPRRPGITVDREGGAVCQAFGSALARRDFAGAAAILAKGRRDAILPLDVEMALDDELLGRLLRERDVTGAQLAEIAAQMGWLGAAGQIGGPRAAALGSLQARIDAETWLAGMQKEAQSWDFWIGAETAAAARLLLGRGGRIGLASRVLPPVPQLRRALAQFQFHGGWISHRLDRERIAAIDPLARRDYPGLLAWILWAAAWIGIMGPVALAFGLAGAPGLAIAAVFVAYRRLVPRYSRKRLVILGLGMCLVTAATALVLDAMPGLSGVGARSWEAIAGGLAIAAPIIGLVALLILVTRAAVPVLGEIWFFLRSNARSLVAASALSIVVGIGLYETLPPLDLPLAPEVHSYPEGSPDWVARKRHDAQTGNRLAAFQLGKYLVESNLGETADEEAARDLREAASLYSEAEQMLGDLYEAGRGVPKDLAAARSSFLTPPGPGEPARQVHVANMLANGVGGPADPAAALRLYLRAARQGNAEAIAAAGAAYLQGRGTPVDRARGIAWTTIAAQAGQAEAMLLLGEADLVGTAGKPDPGEAYRWLSLAARWLPVGDARLPRVRGEIQKAAQRLAPAARDRLDADIRAWGPLPAKPPA
jgi:TPR repeat protein